MKVIACCNVRFFSSCLLALGESANPVESGPTSSGSATTPQRADPAEDASDDALADESETTSSAGEDVEAQPSQSTAERPSYNKGVGFYVKNGKLYDAAHSEFRVRGVNKLHWDVSPAGLAKVNASVARWTIDFKRDADDNVALLQGAAGHGGTIAEGSVIIPGNWDGTCKDDPKLLEQMVDTWVAQASAWTKLEKYMILNIANEWGPRDSVVWRDAYVRAVKRIREAGYHATISVTAGGCGQDPDAILKYGQDVFDADPELNVIFDQHIYGEYQDLAGGAPGKYDDMPDLASHADALQKTGLVVMLGEFGPGRDIGPSPTSIDPLRVVEIAEKHQLGWLAWAWDDNNLPGGMSDDKGFSMTVAGNYESSDDLTSFGRTVIEHSTWGIKKLARRASIFQ